MTGKSPDSPWCGTFEHQDLCWPRAGQNHTSIGIFDDLPDMDDTPPPRGRDTNSRDWLLHVDAENNDPKFSEDLDTKPTPDDPSTVAPSQPTQGDSPEVQSNPTRPQAPLIAVLFFAALGFMMFASGKETTVSGGDRYDNMRMDRDGYTAQFRMRSRY